MRGDRTKSSRMLCHRPTHHPAGSVLKHPSRRSQVGLSGYAGAHAEHPRQGLACGAHAISLKPPSGRFPGRGRRQVGREAFVVHYGNGADVEAVLAPCGLGGAPRVLLGAAAD